MERQLGRIPLPQQPRTAPRVCRVPSPLYRRPGSLWESWDKNVVEPVV
jgi:hypothetical protein